MAALGRLANWLEAGGAGWRLFLEPSTERATSNSLGGDGLARAERPAGTTERRGFKPGSSLGSDADRHPGPQIPSPLAEEG